MSSKPSTRRFVGMMLILVTGLLWVGLFVVFFTILEKQVIENRLDVDIAVTPVVKQPWKTNWFIPGVYKCLGVSFTPEIDIPISAHQKIVFQSHSRLRVNGVIVRQGHGKRVRLDLEGSHIWITRDNLPTGTEISQEVFEALERSPPGLAGWRLVYPFLLTGIFGFIGLILLRINKKKECETAKPATSSPMISGRNMNIARISFALTWALAASFATSMIGVDVGPWLVRRYFDPSAYERIRIYISDWALVNIILLIPPALVYTYYHGEVYNCRSDKDGWDRLVQDLMTDSPYAKPIICAGFFAGLVMPTIYALVRYYLIHG